MPSHHFSDITLILHCWPIMISHLHLKLISLMPRTDFVLVFSLRTNWVILGVFAQSIPLAENQIVCKDPQEDCQIINASLIKCILVPFDNSQYAFRAFAHALDLAKKYGSMLVIVAVSNESDKTQWVNETPSRQRGVGKSRNEEFKEIFKKLEFQASRFHVKCESLILESNLIAEAIISFATKKHVDYIVMGTHGKGQAKEMMLGRVSTSIALNAHCPVVLVK